MSEMKRPQRRFQKAIVEGLDKRRIQVPISEGFLSNGHLLLKKFPATAMSVGQVQDQSGSHRLERRTATNFQVMIECAVENQKPVRIGVNWGIAGPVSSPEKDDGRT